MICLRRWSLMRWVILLVLGCWLTPLSANNHFAQYWPVFERKTTLISATQGSGLSQQVMGLRYEGYYLADGSWLSFDDWYRTSWRDVKLSWLTEMAPDWGILWGISTGERGEKYTIQPSLKLGLIMHKAFNNKATLSARMALTMGGRLREYSCIADYGVLGTEAVNCRLAAGLLAPQDTLAYLLDAYPHDRWALQIGFNYRF